VREKPPAEVFRVWTANCDSDKLSPLAIRSNGDVALSPLHISNETAVKDLR